MEYTVSALQDMQLYISEVGGKIILKCIFPKDLDHLVWIQLAQEGIYYVFCENDNEPSSSIIKAGFLCLTKYIFKKIAAMS